jgi:hypothetical protein
MFLIRAFFILIGIESLKRVIVGYNNNEPLDSFYPLLGYIGLVGSIILIDYRAKITNKPVYIRKGILETALILGVLVLSWHIAGWVRPIIALPEIFFAMVLSVTLGMTFSRWKFGPTIRALAVCRNPRCIGSQLYGGRLPHRRGIFTYRHDCCIVLWLLWTVAVDVWGLALLIGWAKPTTSEIWHPEWPVHCHILV